MAAETPSSSFTAPEKPPLPLLHRIVNLDKALSLQIHTACLPIPRILLKTLEISGDGRFWFPIPISLLSFYSRSPILIGLIIGSVLDLLIVGFIKHFVRRPRPVYNNGMNLTFAVDRWSFPSGHSSRVFFIASFLSVCADSYGGICGYFVWVWSVGTSVSRVLLGRHFVIDVIAGGLLGLFEAVIVFWLMGI